MEPNKNIKKLEFIPKRKLGLLEGLSRPHSFNITHTTTTYIRTTINVPPLTSVKKKNFWQKSFSLIGDFIVDTWKKLYNELPITLLIFLALFITTTLTCIVSGDIFINSTLVFSTVFIPFLFGLIEAFFND